MCSSLATLLLVRLLYQYSPAQLLVCCRCCSRQQTARGAAAAWLVRTEGEGAELPMQSCQRLPLENSRFSCSLAALYLGAVCMHALHTASRLPRHSCWHPDGLVTMLWCANAVAAAATMAHAKSRIQSSTHPQPSLILTLCHVRSLCSRCFLLFSAEKHKCVCGGVA